MTADATKAGTLKISMNGCGLTMPLAKPLVVGGDGWHGRLRDRLAYPSVLPYFWETTPAVQYYKVANSKTSAADLTETDVNVLVKVLKDADKAFSYTP